MNILIITDSFFPMFAPRMGYLALYMQRKGWDSDVLTVDYTSNVKLYGLDELEVSVSRISGDILNQQHSYVKKFLNTLVTFNGEHKQLANDVYKQADKLVSEGEYDLVIVSASNSYYLADVGARVSEKHGLPWVIDYRDIYEQFAKPRLRDGLKPNISHVFKKLQILRRNKVIKSAKACITVSEGHKQIMEKYHKSVFKVYNGYDSDLYKPKNIVNPDTFILLYGGQLYTDLNLRDPRVLFKAMDLLHSEGKINSKNFKLHLYVNESIREFLMSLLTDLNLGPYIEFCDQVGVEEFASKIDECALCILVLARNTKGIMTTKLFEYVGAGKPIIAVPNDKGCVETFFTDNPVGCITSEDRCAADFIHHSYLEWVNGRSSNRRMNPHSAEAYSRENQSLEFIRIIENIHNE